MKDFNLILVAPVISEKSSGMKEQKKYSFRVAIDSNKIEVKKAVESVFNVKVEKVNMVLMAPKWKRVRAHYGYTDTWKKAVVTLKDGEIDFYKV